MASEQVLQRFELFSKLNEYKEKQNEKTKEQDNKHISHCEHVIKKKKNMNVCEKCGILLEYNNFNNKEWISYSNKYTLNPIRVQLRKIHDKSIYNDIDKFNFDKNIAFIANETYKQITYDQIFRGRSRKAIIFACVIHAFKKMNKPQNHDKILKQFQINRKSGLFGLRYLNVNISKKEKNPFKSKKYITPVVIIKEVMSYFNGTTEQIEEVKQLYTLVKNKSSKINRSRPKSVANALVYYWIQKNNININLHQFSKKVNMSELTINRLVKEIHNILKSKDNKN